MDHILMMVLAFIVIGFVLMATFKVDNNVRSHTIDMRENVQLQENFSVMASVIENDLSKIGHGLLTPANAIRVADTSRILYDFDATSRVSYDSQRVELVLETVNQGGVLHKKLVKKINGTTRMNLTLGLQRFRLRYFNQQGLCLPTPVVADSLKKIKEIEVTLIAKAQRINQNKDRFLLYQSRVVPKNLLIIYGR
jgi:hypothetical protein